MQKSFAERLAEEKKAFAARFRRVGVCRRLSAFVGVSTCRLEAAVFCRGGGGGGGL